MENHGRARKPPPEERVKLTEYDAVGLVGGIVEKGISVNDTPAPPFAAPPRPSVLPFPVARHRSHGPHWTAKSGGFNASGFGDGGSDEDEEDDDPTNYDPIAKFAKPIKKKKKKGLDLSWWREFATNNDVSIMRKKEKDSAAPSIGKVNGEAMKINGEKSMDQQTSNEPSSTTINNSALFKSIHDSSLNVDYDPAFASMAIESKHLDDAGLHRMASHDIDKEIDKHSASMGFRSLNDEPRYTSLESEIDAENRALVQRMSADEIAEAQEEISRINPELLNILRKRGQEKIAKQRSSTSVSAANDVGTFADAQVMERVVQEDKSSPSIANDALSPTLTPRMQAALRRLDHENAVQKICSSSTTLWDSWSKRVEAVRDLRFSLDGNVATEHAVDHSGYTADNVAERDLLRTEGDPSAAGYTIKEALALTRSVVPGQRALALHLLVSVLSKALNNIIHNQVGCTIRNFNHVKGFVDWEAIWAYALGPEPELVLSLRLALDDNHNSVVLACARVIQCVLACDANEDFLELLEKTEAHVKGLYTAPVFRCRPDINLGFLHGGFWKYSTKPSNIVLSEEDVVDGKNGERTIQDDNVIAGQDIAAGLVRMGILPRLCYLLETDPSASLEECIFSILTAIARHSPTCAKAILKCQTLVETIVSRFTMNDMSEVKASRIKAITLLRVLAQTDKSICIQFIENGIFHNVTWNLYRVTSSINEWLKISSDHRKLASELMIEQLRFWKVCVIYGQCVSYFTNFFPALCLWLTPPTFEKLMEKGMFLEFASITNEIFFVLEALSQRLPSLCERENMRHRSLETSESDAETWCWSDVGPMVDMGLKWIDMIFDRQNDIKVESIHHNTNLNLSLWVISSVLHMLSAVLIKATPEERCDIGQALPEFVSKIAKELAKIGIITSDHTGCPKYSTKSYAKGSFIEKLCHFRLHGECKTSLASVCCLHGLSQVTVSIDRLMSLAKSNAICSSSQVLGDLVLKSSLSEWRGVFNKLMKEVVSDWNFVRKVEVFGRGGPAPGVGVGWGACCGGFWSSTVSLCWADARLFVELLEMFKPLPRKDLFGLEEKSFIVQIINASLGLCLIMGPGERVIIEKVFNILLQIPVLKYLDICSRDFLSHEKLFKLEHKENELEFVSEVLSSHFRNRWLAGKKKKPKEKDSGRSSGHKPYKKAGSSLDTVFEDIDMSTPTYEDSSLIVEWAHQRLPLPNHWLLSPLTTIPNIKVGCISNASNGVNLPRDPIEFLDVAKSGLFFLLGIEAISLSNSDEGNSPVRSIPLIWKLHSLSMVLLVGMGVLEEEKTRVSYEALQRLYGQRIGEDLPDSERYVLRFQAEIHDSYSTFIEALVDQFAAISYGDWAYGRQIAIYLHRLVEAPVRLAAWNALSNTRVLELLPPLDQCLSESAGYLEPTEEDEGVLEAYVKTWVSGALDRAATRGSATYTIALHHVSSFIFGDCVGEKLALRNKLVKLLLRDYSRKRQHEGMILDLIQYSYNNEEISTKLHQRLQVLTQCCEGNSSLLTEVERLKSCVADKHSTEHT